MARLETLTALPYVADLEPLGHSTTENFRKGGVHELGTVVFTDSTQFGVPVVYIWDLASGITS